MPTADKTKVYLMIECPYCLKFRIFLNEADLDDKVELIVFNSGDDTHQSVRNQMIEAGQKPSFPAAELEKGKLTPETDDLIAHFARPAGVDPAKMPLLTYFLGGVFPATLSMHQELTELKESRGA